MSLYPYSRAEWSSSESSTTDERSKPDGGGWWKNTKDAIKRPWKWKRGEAKKSPPSCDPWKREAPFGAFPPFIAQLSPGVSSYQQERRNSNPEDRRRTEQQEDFDLPEYGGQRRPRLDSVFPMRHTPAVSKVTERREKTPSSRSNAPGAGLAVSGKAVGRSSSFNEADSRVSESRGKEEEGTGRELEDCTTSGGHVRGDSVDSTDGSGDRTIDRRKRRLGAVRQLPKLPPRTNYGYDWTDVHSLPEVGHRRRRRATPAPLERGAFGSFQPHYRGPMSPPRGTMMQNFSSSPWGSPAESLPTLAEESDSGEIKGFDNFRLY